MGASVLASAWEREPLPVPLSTTRLPGFSCNCNSTSEMSVLYRICVRCGRHYPASMNIDRCQQLGVRKEGPRV